MRTSLVSVHELQVEADQLYGRLDVETAMLWFMEEIGELCRAVRRDDDRTNLIEELGQVSMWTICLANIFNLDLRECIQSAIDKEYKRQMAKYGEIRPCIRNGGQ